MEEAAVHCSHRYRIQDRLKRFWIRGIRNGESSHLLSEFGGNPVRPTHSYCTIDGTLTPLVAHFELVLLQTALQNDVQLVRLIPVWSCSSTGCYRPQDGAGHLQIASAS